MTHKGARAVFLAGLLAVLLASSCHSGTRHARTLLLNGYGIGKGDPVTYLGLHVGRVSKIDFAQGQVLLSLEFDRSDVPLRAQDSIRIASSGILGGLTVQIVPGPLNAAALEDME